MQTKLHVIAVESLNPAAFTAINGHPWHPPGTGLEAGNPLWVAVGYRADRLNVRLAVPVTGADADSLVLQLLNKNGDPVELDTSADPIRAWVPAQVMPEPK